MNGPRDKNTSGFIGAFLLNGYSYEHRIFSADDDRIECRGMAGELYFTYDRHAYCFDKNGKQIGKFFLTTNYRWLFTDNRAGDTWTFGVDLLNAEIEVSKLILSGEIV